MARRDQAERRRPWQILDPPPAPPPRRTTPRRAPRHGSRTRFRYPSRAMQITTTPAPKSTIIVEVEVPAERLTTALGEAVRALSRRTHVPGFRPGKAPRGVLEAVLGHGAVLDEAVDHLVQTRLSRRPDREGDPAAHQRRTSRSSRPRRASRSSSRRPSRSGPRSSSATTGTSTSGPRSRRSTTAKVDKVIEELRDQNASLSPVEDRGAAERRLRGHRVRGHARRRRRSTAAPPSGCR